MQLYPVSKEFERNYFPGKKDERRRAKTITSNGSGWWSMGEKKGSNGGR
jgi:hypothetical protein